MEKIDFDDFEEKLVALSKISGSERGKLWDASYDPSDMDHENQGMSGHALEVYEHLAGGDLEDALYECMTRFHLESHCPEEVRLRSISRASVQLGYGK